MYMVLLAGKIMSLLLSLPLEWLPFKIPNDIEISIPWSRAIATRCKHSNSTLLNSVI